MTTVKYSHGEHMAQLGKVNGLLEAQSQLMTQITKEQKTLKGFEHRKLLEEIENDKTSRNQFISDNSLWRYCRWWIYIVSNVSRSDNDTMSWILIKTILISVGLIGCGYILGRDSGIRRGASDVIDKLCQGGYINFRRTGKDLREIELIKLNGDVE